MHGHVQVARRGAAQSGLALPGQPDPLAVLDARRDPHVNGAAAGGDTGSLALLAGVLDGRPRAAAVCAWLGEAKSALVAADHTGAVARGAHLGASPWPGSAAVTVGACRRASQPQRHR